jgi:hypothetical protein
VTCCACWGKPIKAEPFREGKKTATLYVYKVEGEISGELVVTLDNPTGAIFNVQLNPRSLSREQAVKHFGGGYENHPLRFRPLSGRWRVSPLYESPTGNLAFIEYRSHGIAILINEEGKVDEIKYVSEPVGSKTSRCKK